MQNWKLTLSYDGTSFHGWQVQPGLATVQGTLAAALHRITGETVLPQGSGRTDTGVHALVQVASFTLAAPIPAASLHRALNRALPASIRILAAEPAAPDFHARHSARRKTYEYRILPVPARCSPFQAPFVWAHPRPLDLDPMQQAAPHILGTHDFTAFAAADPDRSTRNANDGDPSPGNIRTILHSCWQIRDAILTYRVTGTGFLHHMVRNLVGTFAEIGAGRLTADAIPSILAARNRSAAGPTAPAQGLFLVEVLY